MADLPGSAGHRSSTAHKWAPSLYFVIGQAGWFACVMSAADGAPWIGVALAVVLVTLHVVRVARPVEEFKLLACVVVVGGIWESALVHSGLLVYPGGTVIEGFAPYWILALWALFAAQFNTTYGWLKPRMGPRPCLARSRGHCPFGAEPRWGRCASPNPGPPR